jgi:hypothetical protein
MRARTARLLYLTDLPLRWHSGNYVTILVSGACAIIPQNLINDSSGFSAIEYALIAALMAVAAIPAIA